MSNVTNVVENTDVNIHVLGSSILFRINYRPEIEYFYVKNLKNQPVSQFYSNAQVQTYTGFTQLQGSLVFKIDNDNINTVEYVHINETLTKDMDKRFEHLGGLAVTNVTDELYSPLAKFDYDSRHIDLEQKLFDEAMTIFRDNSLEQLLRQAEFIRKITGSSKIEWKTW
jgi:hypothetical protein